jgi:CobQ/CobB/MinD/ParA nucleotide binding domain
MGRICTIAIHERGTGKTTVSAHVAVLASEQRSKTLPVDLGWRPNSKAQNETVARFRSELGEFMIPHALAESATIADAAHWHKPVWRSARTGSRWKAGRDARQALSWVLGRPITTREVAQ